MHTFLDIALSFPTIIFSVMLMVSSAYFLLTLIGVFDADVFDAASGDLGGFSAAALKLGLAGFPLPLVFLGISLLGWVGSYFADYFVLRHLSNTSFFVVYALVAAFVAFLIATPLTGLILKPLRPLFANISAPDPEAWLGKVAIVRSLTVNQSHGEADLDDGGAGLILKIRSHDTVFTRGDHVILVEYLPVENAYRVIAH